MNFKRMTISGFRSFAKASTIHFPEDQVGFYLLGGLNEVEPHLGANGTGKSSLWDALVWCMYGKTARGLKASNIINWAQNDATQVTICFATGGEYYELSRMQAPNALLLKTGFDGVDAPVTQEQVNDLFGVDYEEFLFTALMGQFNRFFFDLSATEKLQIFSQILDLDIWMAAAAEAKSQAKLQTNQLQDLDRVCGTLKGRQTTLEDQCRTIANKADAFETERRQAVKKAEKSHREAQENLRDLEEQREGVVERHKSAQESRTRVSDKLVGLDRDLDEAREERSEAGSEVKDLQNQINHKKKQLKELKGLDSVCPKCLQTVDKYLIEELEDSLHEELGRLDGMLVVSEQRLEDVQDVIKKKQELLDSTADKLERAEAAERKWVNELSKLRQSITFAERVVAETEGHVEKEKQKSNPYDDMLVELREEFEGVKEELKKVREEENDLKKQLDHSEFWAAEFKKVRLWLVETALIQFEIEVNNSLIELGLDGWEVTFDVERETKSGGVSKGFSVFITSPQSSEPVPWDAWSGGETQRLRIAGSIGLANLIRSRTGFEPSLEVWDEPTAHLSQEGIDDLLEFFEHRARTEDRQIWLVDHRSLSYGGFDERMRVIKGELGSCIEQEKRRRRYECPREQ